MVDGRIDFSRVASMQPFLPHARAIAAATRMTTPVGRALAAEIPERFRVGEEIMSPLLKMALRNIERSGPAAYGLPFLAL